MSNVNYQVFCSLTRPSGQYRIQADIMDALQCQGPVTVPNCLAHVHGNKEAHVTSGQLLQQIEVLQKENIVRVQDGVLGLTPGGVATLALIREARAKEAGDFEMCRQMLRQF